MSETPHELTHVWCHKIRIAFFLSAMRHFRDEFLANSTPVYYAELAANADDDAACSFAERLAIDGRQRLSQGESRGAESRAKRRTFKSGAHAMNEWSGRRRSFLTHTNEAVTDGGKLRPNSRTAALISS